MGYKSYTEGKLDGVSRDSGSLRLNFDSWSWSLWGVSSRLLLITKCFFS